MLQASIYFLIIHGMIICFYTRSSTWCLMYESFPLPVTGSVSQFTDEVSEILWNIHSPAIDLTGMWSLAPVFIMDIFKDVLDTSVCSPTSLLRECVSLKFKMRPFSRACFINLMSSSVHIPRSFI